MFRFLLILIVVLSSCADDQTEHPPQNENISPLKKGENPTTSSEIVSDEDQVSETFPQIEPKDERKTNPKIDSLLITVESAIEQKDVELLLTVMDTSIISSYGGGMYGHKDFRELWQYDDYEELWRKLDKVISLGGFFANDSTYSVPYTGNIDQEAMKIDDNIVPYGCGITIDSKSLLYPNNECVETEAIEIGRTYCIVIPQSGFWGATNGLWKVNILGTDISGYVKPKGFYCSADYSLSIEKGNNGDWKITAFAPWD